MSRKISACNVEVSPSEVYAGADLTLKISRSPGDLPKKTLLIQDEDGALVTSVDLAQLDAETSEMCELVVKAPVRPGTHTWLGVWPEDPPPRISHEETAAPFSFTVKPHSTRVVVWDTPSAIECGEKFTIKLGVKCSCECRPAGWAIEVGDHDKRTLATASPNDGPWPGTDALYYTEVELTAPDTEGLYAWEAKMAATDRDVPHTEGTAGFGVRVVPAAECRLTVVAVDMESQASVTGAKVVVHPYRTRTDERGVAELRIPKGKFTLFVSGRNYLPFRSDGETTTDVTVRAELALDVPPSDADVWS